MRNTFKMSFILSFLLLSACNFSKPLEWIYYDRTKYTFTSEDEETEYVYLCKKGETIKETETRANDAHVYFITQLNIITEAFAEEFMAQIKDEVESGDDEGFSVIGGLQATMKLQKKSKKLAKDVEKKHQCLLIDNIETE